MGDREWVFECLHSARVGRWRIDRVRVLGIQRRVFRDGLASSSIVRWFLRRILALLALSRGIVGSQHPRGCERCRARSKKTTPRPTLFFQFVRHDCYLLAGFDHHIFLFSMRTIPYIDSWRDTIPKVSQRCMKACSRTFLQAAAW